jgi:hypothetical protein
MVESNLGITPKDIIPEVRVGETQRGRSLAEGALKERDGITADVDRMLDFFDRLSLAGQEEIEVEGDRVVKGQQYTTRLEAAVSLFNEGYPKDQVWFVEYGLRDDVSRQLKQERRKDGQLRQQLQMITERWLEAYKQDPAKAIADKPALIGGIGNIIKEPIEGYLFQFQTAEAESFMPHLGLRINRYLPGWQAYVGIARGGSLFFRYDQPLIEGSRFFLEGVFDHVFPLPYVEEQSFKQTPYQKLINLFLDSVKPSV